MSRHLVGLGSLDSTNVGLDRHWLTGDRSSGLQTAIALTDMPGDQPTFIFYTTL